MNIVVKVPQQGKLTKCYLKFFRLDELTIIYDACRMVIPYLIWLGRLEDS